MTDPIEFSEKEKVLLQEMFDMMHERLSDDIREIYIYEDGPNEGKPLPTGELLTLWLGDLYTTRSLALKFGINFDFEKAIDSGITYLEHYWPK